jgi:hypothetical protein
MAKAQPHFRNLYKLKIANQKRRVIHTERGKEGGGREYFQRQQCLIGSCNSLTPRRNFQLGTGVAKWHNIREVSIGRNHRIKQPIIAYLRTNPSGLQARRTKIGLLRGAWSCKLYTTTKRSPRRKITSTQFTQFFHGQTHRIGTLSKVLGRPREREIYLWSRHWTYRVAKTEPRIWPAPPNVLRGLMPNHCWKSQLFPSFRAPLSAHIPTQKKILRSIQALLSLYNNNSSSSNFDNKLHAWYHPDGECLAGTFPAWLLDLPALLPSPLWTTPRIFTFQSAKSWHQRCFVSFLLLLKGVCNCIAWQLGYCTNLWLTISVVVIKMFGVQLWIKNWIPPLITIL